MRLAKSILVIALFASVSTFGQIDDKSFASELTPIQKELLAKLTGHTAIELEAEFGNGERTLVRKEKLKLSDRYTVFGRKASADFLYDSLSRIGLKPERHSYKTSKEGANIYAIIPATVVSDEYVVLGAHYDSVKGSPGANDNASGTTLVYGVAFKLAKLKVRKRNFIIVFFDQEEGGLVGSRAFAKKLKSDGFNLHSAHTVDQMGWDEDGDRAIELELPTPELEALYRAEAKKLSIIVHKTRVPSTDHTAFREIGFNAIGVTEEYRNNDTTPHYHKTTDTYQTIDFRYLASTTRLVFNVMKSLAENN